MIINLSDLLDSIDRAIALIGENANLTDLSIAHDWYWTIALEDAVNIENFNPTLMVGSIFDDIGYMRSIGEEDLPLHSLQMDGLASLIRYLAREPEGEEQEVQVVKLAELLQQIEKAVELLRAQKILDTLNLVHDKYLDIPIEVSLKLEEMEYRVENLFDDFERVNAIGRDDVPIGTSELNALASVFRYLADTFWGMYLEPL